MSAWLLCPFLARLHSRISRSRRSGEHYKSPEHLGPDVEFFWVHEGKEPRPPGLSTYLQSSIVHILSVESIGTSTSRGRAKHVLLSVLYCELNFVSGFPAPPLPQGCGEQSLEKSSSNLLVRANYELITQNLNETMYRHFYYVFSFKEFLWLRALHLPQTYQTLVFVV